MFSDRIKYLSLLFLLALLIRILFVFFYPHETQPDEGSWESAAIALNSGQGFGDTPRHPGYIVFLSAVFMVSGDGNITAVRLVQSILSALQIVLIFLLAQRIFEKELVSWLAAVFLTFYPYAVYHTAHLLCESFYSFMLTLLFYLIFSLLSRKRAVLFSIFGGAAFGAAVLTKSTVLPVLPFIIAWFAVNRIGWKPSVIFLIAAGLTILPRTVQNYKRYGEFVPVNLSGSYFFQANNPKTPQMEKDTRELKEVYWYSPEWREIAKLPPIQADREYRRQSLEFIRENPGTVLHLMKLRFLHFWRLYPITKSKLRRTVAMLSSGILLPLCWVGIILSLPHWRKTFVLLALIACFNLVHLIFLSMLRYRVPIDPFFLIFAAYASVELFTFVRNRYFGTSAPA